MLALMMGGPSINTTEKDTKKKAKKKIKTNEIS